MMAGKKTKHGGRLRLIVMRRMVQLFFLAVFVFLFLQTDYNGSDHLDAAVNILFRLDPFLALSVTLAAKTLIALFLPALVVVVLTFFFGRVFCGWFCPMGTLLDLCGKFMPAAGREKSMYFAHLPLLILIFALVSATFGFAFAGYVDPF